MKHLPLALVCVLTLGLPVAAGGAPSKSHIQAATELLEIMKLEQSMLGGATAMADAMIAQNPGLSLYRDVLLEWTAKFMTWKTMGPKFVALYAESFTEKELREMLTFYKTPTGQKTVALMPELMRRGAMFGGELAQQHARELEEMVKKRAAALEKGSTKP